MKTLDRKIEKTMILITGVWEIISGFITIFIYGMSIKNKGIGLEGISQVEVTSVQLLLDNVYIVTTTLGFLFIIFGIINISVYTNIKEVKAEKKKAIWLIICAVISYLLMDFLSGILLMFSAVIMLAKNKAILNLKTQF